MRTALGHWFRIPDGEEQSLWQDGIFSFDASALLNIYAYSQETRSELITLIEAQTDRVRLPFQFALEYSRNRGPVVVKQINSYIKADAALQEFERKYIAPKREHPHLSEASLKALAQIREELAAGRKEMERMTTADAFAERMLTVFDGRLGNEPTETELAKFHSDAKDRYDRQIPPGYADLKEKGAPDAYGDYIGWSQLMILATREAKGVVLVTDDQKEDWWLMEHDRTIGPRPELVQEFRRSTGQAFWMYTSESFLRAAKKFTKVTIRDQAIEEVTERLATDREASQMSSLKPVFRGTSDIRKATELPDPDKPVKAESLREAFQSGETDKPSMPTKPEQEV